MVTAFQRGAFQFNAFQIAAVGDVAGGFRHEPDELEKRLNQQRGFGRKLFEDMTQALAEKAEEAPQAEDAVAEAVAAVRVAREYATAPQLDRLKLVMAGAISAKTTVGLIRNAQFVLAAANAIHERNLMEDDEEAIALLLH